MKKSFFGSRQSEHKSRSQYLHFPATWCRGWREQVFSETGGAQACCLLRSFSLLPKNENIVSMMDIRDEFVDDLTDKRHEGSLEEF
ncbi:MAG: hypothetical protein AB7U29_14135 [Desulfobulbus sp.]